MLPCDPSSARKLQLGVNLLTAPTGAASRPEERLEIYPQSPRVGYLDRSGASPEIA